jgi:hypothetical protein
MGHTQFIPTTYLSYAVDFNGDGRRDLWSDDPGDALASAAHYLASAGWVKGQPWGVEVQVTKAAAKSSGKVKSVAEWRNLGVVLGSGARVPDHGKAKLVTSSGPGFLLFHNGLVLGAYNASNRYIVGVGHLSDRIAGKADLVGAFPPDANGLTQADRVFMQERLTRMGYDCGSTDGVFGPKTAAAIAGFQVSKGLKATGKGSPDLLRLLR